MWSSLVDSHSKVAEEGSDVLSPLVIALDDILHLKRTSKRFSTHNGIGKTAFESINIDNPPEKPQQRNKI